MQRNFFEILVQTALTVGLFWTILKVTPKSALLSFTILYYEIINKTLVFWPTKTYEAVASVFKDLCPTLYIHCEKLPPSNKNFGEKYEDLYYMA